jgi:sorting nexin-25
VGELRGNFNTDEADCRIVREQVSKYLVESYIVNVMKKIQEAIWPNGILRKTPPTRTTKEKAKTKRDAGFKLATIFEGPPHHPMLTSDSAGSIMGHANARSGAARLASLCQNTHLNTHFAYTVLDELIATLFPELGHPRASTNT